MKMRFKPWFFVDPEPGDGGEGAGTGTAGIDPAPTHLTSPVTPQPTGEAGEAETLKMLQNLRAELDAKEKALANSRKIERQYKSIEALLGTTDPEKLQQLREAEQLRQQQESQMEEQLAAAKAAALEGIKPTLETLKKEKVTLEEATATLKKDNQQIKDQFEIFKAFNGADGIGSRFDGFIDLAARYFNRGDNGALQVKDSLGNVVQIEESGAEAPATPAQFMKLLAKGQLPEKYVFSSLELIQQAFPPANQSQGANLPTSSGFATGKALHEMSQAELAKHAFKR